MAQQQQTPKVVPPSDQANCEVVKGSFELESGTCGESELVCELPHSEEYVLPQEENCPKDDIPPKDGHPARNAYPNNDGNISQGTQDAGGNPTTQTPTSFQLNHINVGCITCIIPVAVVFLYFVNPVGADQNCHRVLTANDVDDSDSNLLHFSGGQYKEIEEGAFGNSEAAELLDLSYNCLSNVLQDTFDNMTSVISINMAWNHFSSYPPAFQKSEILSNLEHLSFVGNNIHYLGMDYFIGKEKLSILNFTSNGMESIHNQAFDPLSALKILYLSENHLTSLSFLNVTKLKNLVQLYVTNNILKYLNIKGFSNCPEITRISISEDSMTLERNDREDPIVFWIAGNSETLSCEDNKHDIERAEIPIEYNFTCQNRNSTSQVLEGTMLPTNSPTTETSQGLEGSSLPQNTPTAVTSRVFEGSSLPQHNPTKIMSSVTYSSTPFPCPNDNLPWILVLSSVILVFLAVVVLMAIRIVLLERKTQHYKREVEQLRMGVSSNSNGTNGVVSPQSIELMEKTTV